MLSSGRTPIVWPRMGKKHEIKLGRNQGYRDFEKKCRWFVEHIQTYIQCCTWHLEGINARIKVRESATSNSWKARAVPFALRPKEDKELNHLEEAGILSKLEHSEWATSIVPIPKRDCSVNQEY